MSNEPVRQITAKELYEEWVIGNPHYDFELDFMSILDKSIKSIELNVLNKGVYRVDLEDFYVDVFADCVVNIKPKKPLFVELTDPASLDETLPINPATVAQQDHDEIVRLQAENAAMRSLLNSVSAKLPTYIPDDYRELPIRAILKELFELGIDVAMFLEKLS